MQRSGLAWSDAQHGNTGCAAETRRDLAQFSRGSLPCRHWFAARHAVQGPRWATRPSAGSGSACLRATGQVCEDWPRGWR